MQTNEQTIKGRTQNLGHGEEWHRQNYDIIRRINGQNELKHIKSLL